MFAVNMLSTCIASLASYCACQGCACVSKNAMKQARASFCFLFTLAMLLAWLMRDFAKPMMEKIPWIVIPGFEGVGVEQGDDDFSLASERWYGIQAVYRISMGNFLYFCSMSLALIGVQHVNDSRAKVLHNGNWLLKLFIWLAFTALPFFFPQSVINAYSWLARFGSALFLALQLIILLSFFQDWNDSWVQLGEEDDPRYFTGLLLLSALSYGGTLTLTGFLYVWFKPSDAGDCSLNVALITITLLLCLGISLLAIQPFAQRGSLFVASTVSLYCTYLAYSALTSEPHTYPCNSLGQQLDVASGFALAGTMLLTILAVVYAAFRAGSNTSFLDDDEEQAAQQLVSAENAEGKKGGEADEEKVPVAYSYSFFHMIFALASTYIAMLMTSWGAGAAGADLIDVGWTSMWVKFASQWVAFGLYGCMLMWPVFFPDRDYSY